MSIVLLDERLESLTVSWPAIPRARCYILEYRTSETDWELLSDSVRQTQVRKRNLHPECEYFFRVAAVFDRGPGDWIFHDEGFFPLTWEAEDNAMLPPTVRKEEDGCLVITWGQVESAFGYEVQMRENIGGAEWCTIGTDVRGTGLKKRRLHSTNGYMFRVQHLSGEFEEAFSGPSEVKVAVPVPKKKQVRAATVDPKASDNYSMPAPWVKNGGPQALLICWRTFDGAKGYEIQMRENVTRGKWTTIAGNVRFTEVKKKNLSSISGYQFRIRPLGTRETRFSAPSYGAIASQALPN